MSKTIGYIGLGNIGKPMAASFAKAALADGHRFLVYDVVEAPVRELVELGAEAAASPQDIAHNCDFVSICVRDDHDMENLLYGDNDLLDNARNGAIYAVHSTVTRDNVIKWAEEADRRGFHILDAGITGGAMGAADAQLCIMVGGNTEAVERARPLLDYTAKLVVHCGASGAGITTKLALNLMTFVSFAAVDEAVAIMKASGLDLESLYAVGRGNGVLHPNADLFIQGREGLMAGCSREEFEQIFEPSALLGEKDLSHALDLGAQLDLDLSLARQAKSQIRRAFLPEK